VKKALWIYLKFTVFVASIFLGGCTTYGNITALPEDHQKIIYKDDREVLTSEIDNFVSLVPKLEKAQSGVKGDFILTIENRSLNNILFSIKDISANSYNVDFTRKKALRIYTRKRLIKKEKKAQRNRRKSGGLVSTHNLLKSVSKIGTKSFAASMKTQKRHSDKLAKSEQKHEDKLKKLALFVPDKTTILPGKAMSGFIRVRLPKITKTSKRIHFTINLNGTKHKLAFIHEKIEN
jgi:hypothetical protein